MPRAVRATIKKRAAGGKITEIEKDTVNGTVRYEAEVVLKGREFDILVSATGKYLGTEKGEDAEGELDKKDDEDEDS